MRDEWEDVQILDENTLMTLVEDHMYDACLAKIAGNTQDVTMHVTKALDVLADVEQAYPKRVAAIRLCLEMI